MIKSFLVWHKRFALFACVPFMLWAASGLLHPFMSHFTKAERIVSQPVTINSAAIAHYVPLDRVLEKNAICMPLAPCYLSYFRVKKLLMINHLTL